MEDQAAAEQSAEELASRELRGRALGYLLRHGMDRDRDFKMVDAVMAERIEALLQFQKLAEISKAGILESKDTDVMVEEAVLFIVSTLAPFQKAVLGHYVDGDEGLVRYLVASMHRRLNVYQVMRNKQVVGLRQDRTSRMNPIRNRV